MKIKQSINKVYRKVLFFFITVFLILSTVTFSWVPLVGILPVLLIMLFVKMLHMKVYLTHYFFILFVVSLIFYTLNNQIIYIEWVRNILISLLIPIVYFIFIDLNYKTIYRLLFYIFISSLFVIFFILIVSVPQDFALFFGERRGFYAKEFLIFGREYPFSLGVTHLNVYITYVMTFLLMTLIYNPYKYNRRVLYFLLIIIIIALLTQSRSPLLFLIIIFLIFRQYIYYQRKNKFTYFSIRIIILIPLLLFILLIFNIYSEEITNSERLNDVSRFIFYIKGFEHMIEEPWGNNLLYTDITMPLLNYHNTFLAFGNRIAFVFFILLIIYIFYVLYLLSKIKDYKIKYSLYLLMYFCFHNFMIEDIIKFDYFVIILFFALFPIAKTMRGIK